MSPINTHVILHDDEVLWKDMKSLPEVLELKATTRPEVWETTYQGNTFASLQSKIFDIKWFPRYSVTSPAVGRWISLDTGLSDTETSASSSAIIGDLMPDYRLRITKCWSDRVAFPRLVEKTLSLAKESNNDTLLRGIIIENKVSGISLIQTLVTSADKDLASIIKPFNPRNKKEIRWGESAVWCNNGCILLPEPSTDVPWLFDFEQDLINAPDVTIKDRLDSFAQLILFLELYLSQGYRLRAGITDQRKPYAKSEY